MEKYQFGYGCMRLPVTNADDPASFDYPLIEKLFDTYMDQGFTYFDAAYTYHGYHCEEAVKKALVERHPRDRFELATKLPLRDFKDAEDMERIFNEQLAIIDQVREIIEKNTPIPCTACSYCTHGCPKQIAIPQYFALYNSISRTTGSFSSQAVYYNNISLKHGKASDCIGCGQCEKACPQHLPIRDYLQDVAAKFEAGSSFPTKK